MSRKETELGIILAKLLMNPILQILCMIKLFSYIAVGNWIGDGLDLQSNMPQGSMNQEQL